MLVKNWIAGFLERHRMRFAIDDWPVLGTEDFRDFGRMWIKAFTDNEITEEEANRASLWLGRMPPRFRMDHLPAMLKVILDVRAATAHLKFADLRTGFPDCQYCSGIGFVTVYRSDYQGSRVIFGSGGLRGMSPGSVNAHCICKLGRQLRARTSSDVLGRIPDLGEVLAGRTRWILGDPRRDETSAMDEKAGRGAP